MQVVRGARYEHDDGSPEAVEHQSKPDQKHFPHGDQAENGNTRFDKSITRNPRCSGLSDAAEAPNEPWFRPAWVIYGRWALKHRLNHSAVVKPGISRGLCLVAVWRMRARQKCVCKDQIC